MASHSRRPSRATVATLATLRLPLLVILQLALGPVASSCPKKDALRPCSCFSFQNYVRVECKDVDRRALKNALTTLRGAFVFEFELSKYNLKDVPSDVFSGVRVTELYTYMADFTNVCNSSNLFDGFDDNLTMIEIRRAKGLEHLHWSALGRLKNLQRLFVFSSDFPRLHKSFSLMPKSLTHVMVQGGSLEHVDEGAFAGLEIRDLEISFTRLDKITRNVFPTPATSLSVLSLRTKLSRTARVWRQQLIGGTRDPVVRLRSHSRKVLSAGNKALRPVRVRGTRQSRGTRDSLRVASSQSRWWWSSRAALTQTPSSLRKHQHFMH
ncbi:hypothetical protein HPB51_023103 [Rhipicephalus microplus]|uniref:Membrane glycoprotein lig-1 n=1 Tax=Rhipicephalus microplus TaxID=6941 RepID=A0A9J6DK54_RHIMP|nr:hypothetical protein HPB51_023103 [Rhipicephalus microplus]